MGLLQSSYWLQDYDGALVIAEALENSQSRRIQLLVAEWKNRIDWRRSWRGSEVSP